MDIGSCDTVNQLEKQGHKGACNDVNSYRARLCDLTQNHWITTYYCGRKSAEYEILEGQQVEKCIAVKPEK